MGPGWQETTTPLWLGSLHSPCAGLIFTPGATWQAGKVLGSAPGSPPRGRPTLVRPWRREGGGSGGGGLISEFERCDSPLQDMQEGAGLAKKP